MVWDGERQRQRHPWVGAGGILGSRDPTIPQVAGTRTSAHSYVHDGGEQNIHIK